MSESQLASELRELFPLPLVAFEKMMLLDDRESHPMTCGAEFTFEGHFDRSKLESAVRRTCLRHPLFCAHVQRQKGNRWEWVAAREMPYVRWTDDANEIAYDRGAYIDLRSEVGLRIWAQSSPNGTKLSFSFHHACADGAGGLAYIEDLLSLYAASIGNGKSVGSSLPPANHSTLRRRGKFPRSPSSVKQRLLGELSNSREALRFLVQRPQPLSFADQPSLQLVSAESQDSIHSVRFDPGFLPQLRATAAETGVAVNDLLIRALLLTICQWNRHARPQQATDHIRVMMPMNLRSRQDLEMPATNRMSYAIVTRRIEELAHPFRLLKTIAAETSMLRRNHMPQRALSLLSLLDKVPRGIASLFSPQRCLATAVLSNVGDPTRRFRTRFPRDRGLIVVGNVRLTDFTAITPVRPLTRAAFFVNSYANRLTISAHLDPTVASPVDSASLLERFSDQLRLAVCAVPKSRAA